MMIKPESWQDTVLLDGAIGRSGPERIERLLYVWRSLTDINHDSEDRPGHWTTAAIPTAIRAFFISQGIRETAAEDPHYMSGFVNALMADIADDPTDGIYVEDSLMAAMNEDTPAGYLITGGHDGDVLYISEDVARKEGWIE